VPVKPRLLRLQLMLLLSLLLCLNLCLPSMVDLRACATGKDVKDDRLNGDIERHGEEDQARRERGECRVLEGEGGL